VFGHVNNVVYYSWIDTAVNSFLIDRGLLDIAASPVVGVVVETSCRYLQQITHPADVAVGLRISSLGRSSVRYEVAVFRGADTQASADGHFVHVYVDRATMRPTAIPERIRAEMENIHVPG
jgi:acyl-CoA thioester hydrolase